MVVNIPKSGKIIPLNIVMTYPVRWNRYRIYRDFVQNFYDSVGAEHWNEKFKYNYDSKKQTLTMEIEGIEFSYEWLLHIGASTKTANNGKYAGYLVKVLRLLHYVRSEIMICKLKCIQVNGSLMLQ